MSWLPPDSVLTRALRVLQAQITQSSRVLVIRDTRGKIRVAVEKKAAVHNVSVLAAELAAELGAWFEAPIVDGTGSPAHKRIVTELLRGDRRWPVGWPTNWQRADGSVEAIPSMVWGTAVLLSKESWLDTGATTPSATPRVVSFFSFKGGVGRTTTLGCVAARLAARGKKVVAVDLDLEAPGLGVLFDVPTSPGVVDHVLSHLATGDVGEVQPRQVDGISNLWVVPAGELGSGYLEKISRLDFLAGLAAGAASPVESALNALLAAISASVEPDVILLDSRAGLHDMGGLALHRLAHTDVLVARAGEQARAGMGVVLDAIRRLRPNPNDRDVRLVQTMVPMPFDSDVGRPVVDRWRTQMYDLCTETIYEGLDEIPAVNEEVAHFPLLVGHRDELTRVDRLSQIEAATIATFDGIADRLLAPLDEDEGD